MPLRPGDVTFLPQLQRAKQFGIDRISLNIGQLHYLHEHGSCLLCDYAALEDQLRERLVWQRSLRRSGAVPGHLAIRNPRPATYPRRELSGGRPYRPT